MDLIKLCSLRCLETSTEWIVCVTRNVSLVSSTKVQFVERNDDVWLNWILGGGNNDDDLTSTRVNGRGCYAQTHIIQTTNCNKRKR